MEIIILLLIAGILFLFVEIYLTPGSTLFGVIGLILLVIGNIKALHVLPSPWNYVVVLLSLLLVLFFLYLFFKLLTSDKLSVKAEINSKVNEIHTKFSIGAIGETTTSLRPNGRAIFEDEILEVYSTGGYIDNGEPIEIIKITSNKIFVQTKN